MIHRRQAGCRLPATSTQYGLFMPLFWLTDDPLAFPPGSLATPEGILAVGGDLSTRRLLEVYARGSFPWYNEGDPILWWCPDPRFVLFPNELKVSKSMRPYFNQQKFTVTLDTCFAEVIGNCRQVGRRGQGGTWINDDIVASFTELHEMGFAHSVEVWQDGRLAGGLYGIGLGKVFFGESMFALAPNASKFGFITLVRHLEARGYALIDCQQETQHLASLGARAIPRDEFLKLLHELKTSRYHTTPGKWSLQPSL